MQKMFVNKECQKMALVGLGGIGKTQVALQFAHSVRDEQPERSIFWIPALSLESFEQACAEIARILKIPQPLEDKRDIKELVKQQLSSTTAGKWLLIIDNADSKNVLFGSKSSKGVIDYLPESEDGLTLFTSRYQTVTQSLVGSDVLELEKMTEQEAISFLKESLVRKDLIRDNAITIELLIELDYLPLAIAQAAAYINTKKTSIAVYLRLLRNSAEDATSLMSEEFGDNMRYNNSANAVATTWVVSFNQILEDDTIAADLLAFMSCIEWKGIPYSILPAVQPEARMMAAIGTICSYSFAVKRNNEDIYDMHRLVHLATRIWIHQYGRGTETSENAIKHLAKAFPSDDYENREIWREYLPHAVRMSEIEGGKGIGEKHTLFLKVGLCLLEDGRTGEAVTRLEESYRWRNTNLPENHPDRLESLYSLAIAYKANGQIKEAVEILEQVVKIRGTTLAKDHPHRLASQHALALAYEANGQVKEAVEILEQVVKIRETTLAKDHPSRLASQHALAVVYEANGQLKEAVEILEQVVKIKGTTLAKDHPDRLASQHALALAYNANGQVKEAVEILEYVVKIKGTTLAKDHPDRLASQHALAVAYNANGQVKEAVEILEQVVKIEGTTLAKDHPSRLASQHALAVAYEANGQVKEAVEILEQVVKIEGTTLAKNHPDRIVSEQALAYCLRET
jgi:tetratricopeptide (TPR) repeat protein